ncbi:MAG: lycopene cyclase family protein [Janthinobacterium lividum]
MSAKNYVIIGAGAAGLSLCHAMLEQGIKDDIVILDRKAAFTDDRTWCFWNTPAHPYSSLVSHCWHQWDVFSSDGRAASQTSAGIAYTCLRGIDFYDHVLEIISQHPNVTVKLDSPIECCQANNDDVTVTAGGETWDADYVFDSCPRPVPCGGLTFSQRFFGQFIRIATPAFDPARCTLMDFRVSQKHGLHFMYVLPFSPTEALVEDTYVQYAGIEKVTQEQHRQEIRDYLAVNFGVNSFSVQREETGAIPMTTQPFPRRDGRVFFIGTAGGCSKPSSGYTFTRIQGQCRQLAEASAAGNLERFCEQTPHWRYRFFDTVFLQVLADHPDAFPGYFQRLFSQVSPEALTAFLSETSTWPSDLSILRSLPLTPFFSAAIRTAPLWFARQP